MTLDLKPLLNPTQLQIDAVAREDVAMAIVDTLEQGAGVIKLTLPPHVAMDVARCISLVARSELDDLDDVGGGPWSI